MNADIYTDGAASPNPGAGGFCAVVIQSGYRKEISGGFRNTTNNRMEIFAAIEGLKTVHGSGLDVTIYTDSQYLARMFNEGHARRWKSDGWMRNRKDGARNPDLWHRLLEISDQHQVRFEWVKSHSGHPENERCDELAVQARKQDGLPADEGFENPTVPPVDDTRVKCLFKMLM